MLELEDDDYIYSLTRLCYMGGKIINLVAPIRRRNNLIIFVKFKYEEEHIEDSIVTVKVKNDNSIEEIHSKIIESLLKSSFYATYPEIKTLAIEGGPYKFMTMLRREGWIKVRKEMV
jgi:hypothetical protein